MIGVPPSDLDQDRFTHFLALAHSGPADQRALHHALAKRVAASAGLTLLEAVQSIAQHGKRTFSKVIEQYLESAEYKSLAADQEREEQARRRQLIKAYGDADAIMEPTQLERRLMDAVDGLPAFGELPNHFRFEDMSDDLKGIFAQIEPIHATPTTAMAELEEWHRIHRDRQTFFVYDTDWWIDGRKRVLENIVDTYPAKALDDIQARVRLWQMRSAAGAYLHPDEEAAFQQRLLADMQSLEKITATSTATVMRTTKERSEEVCRVLKARPDLSNRAIARRIGVSPQTVANYRAVLNNKAVA